MFNCEPTSQDLLTNGGCGVSFLTIPKWISKSLYRCCTIHDIRYSNQFDKLDADWEMRNCIYYDAYNRSNWLNKHLKIMIADMFFALLQTRMSTYFYYKNV